MDMRSINRPAIAFAFGAVIAVVISLTTLSSWLTFTLWPIVLVLTPVALGGFVGLWLRKKSGRHKNNHEMSDTLCTLIGFLVGANVAAANWMGAS